MTKKNGRRYSAEEKEVVLKRMMPPQNESVTSITEDIEISDTTLYKWRKEARETGLATPVTDRTARNGAVKISF